jgi:hypothetical protein
LKGALIRALVTCALGPSNAGRRSPLLPVGVGREAAERGHGGWWPRRWWCAGGAKTVWSSTTRWRWSVVEQGGGAQMAAAQRISCVLLYLQPRATPPPPLHCCTASRPNRRRIRRIHGWIDLVAAWFGSISSSSFSSSHAMATGELRNVLADGAFTVSSLPPLSSPQLAAPLLSSLPWRAAATTSARWGRGGAVASVAHNWKTLDLGFTGKMRTPRSTVSCGVPFPAPSATGLIDRMGDIDG